jgi:hypothetical protein
MFNLDDSSTAATSAIDPGTPAAAPAPAVEPAPAATPPTWEQQLAAIEELLDRKIAAALSNLAIGPQLAALRGMIVSPAEIEGFVDRKIKAMIPPAPVTPIAPPTTAAAATPAAQPGPTHSEESGNVGATGAHGAIGENEA